MNQKGQALVELAISMVIILFLLAGAVEFGLIFFQYVQLRDAAQEGALYGSVCNCPVGEIEDRVRGSSDKPLNLNDVFIEVTVADTLGNFKAVENACEGDGMTVRLIFPHKIFMPFIPQLIGRSTIDLTASVTDTVLVPLCP